MKRFVVLAVALIGVVIFPAPADAAVAVGRIDIPSLGISRVIYDPAGEPPQRTINSCAGATSLRLIPGLTWLAAHRTHCGRHGFGGVETLTRGSQVVMTLNGQTHTYSMIGEGLAAVGSKPEPPPFGTALVLQTSRDASTVYLRYFEQVGGLRPPDGRGSKMNDGDTVCIDSGGRESEFAVVNLTPTDSWGGGYGTLYPAGGTPGATSAVNWNGPGPSPNTTLTRIGRNGQICVGTAGAPTHMVVDVLAIAAAGSFDWRAERLLDTRREGGPVNNGRLCFNAPGNPGEWAILNVTPIATSAGYGAIETPTRPALLPQISYTPGVPSPNLTFVQLDSARIICYRSAGNADVVIDLEATAPAGIIWGSPYRMLDTRVDAQPALARFCFALGLGGRSAWAFVNLNTDHSTGPGYGRIYSSSRYPDVSSDINYANKLESNAAVLKIDPNTDICVASMGAPTEWMIDSLGYVNGDVFRQPERRRALDTRLPG